MGRWFNCLICKILPLFVCLLTKPATLMTVRLIHDLSIEVADSIDATGFTV